MMVFLNGIFVSALERGSLGKASAHGLSLLRLQLPSAGIFNGLHFFGRDIIVSVIVKRMDDCGAQDCKSRSNRQPPNMPHHCKAKRDRQHTDDKTSAGIFWHVNAGKAFGATHIAILLHVPPAIVIAYMRNFSKIVEWWWRRKRPLKRTA